MSAPHVPLLGFLKLHLQKKSRGNHVEELEFLWVILLAYLSRNYSKWRKIAREWHISLRIIEDPKISSIVKTKWLVLDLVGTWFSRIGNRPEPPRNVTLRAVSQPQKIGTSIKHCQIYHHWIMPIYPNPSFKRPPSKKHVKGRLKNHLLGRPSVLVGTNAKPGVYQDDQGRVWKDGRERMTELSQTIHVWYIYLHLPYLTIKNNQM